MPARHSFDYAAIRVVPRVERQEFINVGVIVFCLGQKFLAVRTHWDDARLRALWPDLDLASVQQHLEGIHRICEGDPHAGPVAKLSLRERFHWLVAPRSTVIQVSPVHSGLCEKPEAALEELMQRLVR